MKAQRFTFLILSLALLGYSSYRACTLSITHDEARTIQHYVMKDIIVEDVVNGKSANNHILNTVFVTIGVRNFGWNPIAFRYHIVLFHALYLVFGMLLIGMLRNWWAAILLFCLLNFNPFILDFFSVARGYGISLGLLLPALYCLVIGLKRVHLWMSAASILLLCFAVLANLSFINVLLSALAVLWLAVWQHRDWPPTRKLVLIVMTLVFGGTLLAWAVPYTFALKDADALYFGTNLFEHMIWSLAGESMYTADYLRPEVVGHGGAAVVLLLGAAGIAVRRWVVEREYRMYHLFGGVFILTVVANIMQHHLFGVNYYYGRTGMMLIPLAAIFLAFVFDYASSTLVKWVSVAVSLIAIGNGAMSVNLDQVRLWDYDADIDMAVELVLDDIEKQGEDRQYTMRAEHYFYNSVMHYVITDEKSPISVQNRYRDDHGWNDYVMAIGDEIGQVGDQYVEMDSFPTSGMMLFKRVMEPLNQVAAVSVENMQDIAHLDHSEAVIYRIMPGDHALDQPLFATCRMQIDPGNGIKHAVLNLSYESEGEVVFWEEIPLYLYTQSWNDWNHVQYTFVVPPDLGAGGELRCYIWNKEKETIKVKDMTMSVSVPTARSN